MEKHDKDFDNFNETETTAEVLESLALSMRDLSLEMRDAIARWWRGNTFAKRNDKLSKENQYLREELELTREELKRMCHSYGFHINVQGDFMYKQSMLRIVADVERKRSKS